MSIYKTVEVDAWSRDFDYEQYKLLHEKCYEQTGPRIMSFDWYQAFCHIMDIEMEDSLK